MYPVTVCWKNMHTTTRRPGWNAGAHAEMHYDVTSILFSKWDEVLLLSGWSRGQHPEPLTWLRYIFATESTIPDIAPPPIQMHYEICKNGILIDINFRLSTRKANTKSTLSTQNATFVGHQDRPITLNLSVVHRTVILRHVTALQRLPSLPCQSPGPSNNNKHNCFKCVRPGRFCTENILSNTNYVSLTTIQKVLEDSVITLWYCVNLDISHSLVGSLLPTYSLASWSTKTFEKIVQFTQYHGLICIQSIIFIFNCISRKDNNCSI